MVCPRCGTPSPGAFCPACGAPVTPLSAPVACQRCGAPYHGSFCPRCGYPAGWPAPYPAPVRGSGVRAFLAFVWLVAIVLFLATLVMGLSVLAYAVTQILPGILSGSGGGVVLFLFFPTPGLYIVVRDTTFFLVFFLAILAVLLFAFAVRGVRDGPRLLTSMLLPITNIAGRLRSRSAWVAIAQLFMATVFVNIAVLLLFTASGISSEPPDFGRVDPWLLFYGLLEASVYEEFLFRFLLLGVPLFLAAVAFHSSTPRTRRPWLRTAARYLLGGNVTRTTARPILVAAFALSIISSAAFGLAHLPNWGAWKVFAAGAFGLAAAYAFLRHGLGASIILHFVSNYFGAGPLGDLNNVGLAVVVGILLLAFIVLGAGFFAFYLIYGVGLLRVVGGRPEAPARRVPAAFPAVFPAAPSPPPAALPPDYAFPSAPPGYGYAPVRFRCARCGWPEARYLDGRFHCKRCGQAA